MNGVFHGETFWDDREPTPVNNHVWVPFSLAVEYLTVPGSHLICVPG